MSLLCRPCEDAHVEHSFLTPGLGGTKGCIYVLEDAGNFPPEVLSSLVQSRVRELSSMHCSRNPEYYHEILKGVIGASCDWWPFFLASALMLGPLRNCACPFRQTDQVTTKTALVKHSLP